jgi:uncharacterized protein (DUF427 family)
MIIFECVKERYTMDKPRNGIGGRIRPQAGQESVWDYPRPPRLEACSRRIRVEFGGKTIADTQRALRVLETSHPPVYYIPFEDIRMEYLKDREGSSFCEWKGRARYYSVAVNGKLADKAAWGYPNPTPAYAGIKDHLAFYPAEMDACTVDGERVRPQQGDFYGGWITENIVGPFKGGPGSWGW